MLDAIVVAIVVGSSIWVYLDATNNKIGKVNKEGGMFNMSAGAWSVVTLLLWIIGFPAYLVKRNSLIDRAKENPVEIRGRTVKASVLSIVGVLWVLSALAGSVSNNEIASTQHGSPMANTSKQHDNASTQRAASRSAEVIPVKASRAPHYQISMPAPLCPDLKGALRMWLLIQAGQANDQVLMAQWQLSGCDMARDNIVLSDNATVNELRDGITMVVSNGVTVFVPSIYIKEI